MARFSVRALRLRPGEEHRETLRLTLDPLVFGGEPYAFAPEEIPAELTVQRATTGDVFRLAFRTRLEGPCMRCLAPAGLDLEVDAQEYDAIDPSDDDQLRSEYVVDSELDLSAWGRDLVALSVPDQILCRPDCAGLCPTCGANWNEGTCDCAPDDDQRWSALAGLQANRPKGR
jgi:uncharacterized protein